MTHAEAVAALESLPAVERISVASLKPTDVIVVNVSEDISMEDAARMRASLREIWPDNRIAVFMKGVELKDCGRRRGFLVGHRVRCGGMPAGHAVAHGTHHRGLRGAERAVRTRH